METLVPFFIILLAGLLFSEMFRKLHLPYVTALVVAGIIIGPVLGVVGVDPVFSFLASIGIIFLMFIAGSEISIESLRQVRRDVIVLSLLNGSIPFICGVLLGFVFQFDLFTSLIIGIAFMSSSVAVIIPSLEALKITGTRIGKTIISATVVEDVVSLVALSAILQIVVQKTQIPLLLYIPLIVFLLIFLKYIVPRLEKAYLSKRKRGDLFENRVQFVIITLIATVILFEVLGMHAIVAGFIIGILLSDLIKGKVEEKIRTISYGFFIPIFFLVMGMQLDITTLFSFTALGIAVAIVIVLFTSKVISGWIGGKYLNFSNKESLLIGIATTPQLSTTLATAYVAYEFGLLSSDLITSFILLSIVTTAITPLLIKIIISSKFVQPHGKKRFLHWPSRRKRSKK